MREAIVYEWNEAQTDSLEDKCVHRLFEAQVLRTPDAMAVLSENGQLTYQALNIRANQLARYLHDRDVGPDTPVGLCVDRSLEMIIGILAVLKAGGFYVPLHPTDPPKRLALMAQKAGVHVLLTTQSLLQRWSNVPQQVWITQSICIDQMSQVIARNSGENLNVFVRPDYLLYLLFTSGSTGTPKGVAMPHRALMNLLWWQQQQTPTGVGQRVLQFTPLTFDVATQEIFTTLCFGGLLVLVSEAVRRNPQALWEFLESQSIERLFLPFVALQQLAQTAQGKRPAGLREVITAGEQLQIIPAIAHFFSDGRCTLHNQYGPTETHVVTAYSLPADVQSWSRLPPIGRPVTNVQIYVLDPKMREVAVGEAGELYVGGVCLARGYYGEPELTQERFMPNPFAPGRLYKTGDLARYLPDNNIEFLGRLDHQVKIRGFRVELGEIEVTLKQHPHVRDAVAWATEDSHGNRQLLACIVPNKEDLQEKNADFQAAHVAHWRQVWDTIYSQPASDQEQTRNHLGWKDSYTGRPIPSAQMREWLDATVDRILSWRPDRVLEIGCGTGSLLRRIAPHCSRYTATDISLEALKKVEQSLARISGSISDVTLINIAADDFRGFKTEAFDTVIINSVVELFPSVDYVKNVVEKALATVRPGGLIFIGDVRSLPLMKAFHASVQLYGAPTWLPIEQLQLRIANHWKKEPQLLIDPPFFTALKQHLPRITHVQSQLRRGYYRNEMTRFRYDVTLHVEKDPRARPTCRWLDWQKNELTLAAIRQHLAEHRPAILGIEHIPNARLLKEARLLELLAGGEDLATVADLRSALRMLDGEGVEPEALWALADASMDARHEHEKLPYVCYVNFSRGNAIDCVDVVYQRYDDPSGASSALFENIRDSQIRSSKEYANDPLESQQLHQLGTRLRDYLAARLPDYMVPAKFSMIDALPLTPSGKIDRRSLPTVSTERPELTTVLVASQTKAECQIAAIWREALQLDTVGIHDNFFDLGGNSMLLSLVYARLAPTCGPKLSFLDLLEHPTIHALAKFVSGSLTEAHESPDPHVDREQTTRRTRLAPVKRMRQRRQGCRPPREQGTG
jgi:amino acid adenylation domain-containing protein